MHLSITSCQLTGFEMSGTPRNKDSYICEQASGSSKRKAKELVSKLAVHSSIIIILATINFTHIVMKQNKVRPEWAADRER